MNTDEFENAMNEGRIERKHCKWMLAEVNRLREVERWAQAHHAKCEDGCGAACVPSEEEVERFHETGDWEEEE